MHDIAKKIGLPFFYQTVAHLNSYECHDVRMHKSSTDMTEQKGSARGLTEKKIIYQL